jgi:hypothetical protein
MERSTSLMMASPTASRISSFVAKWLKARALAPRLGGEPTGGERVESLAVDDLRGDLDDARSGQQCFSGPSHASDHPLRRGPLPLPSSP